jgi:hypothetical protein
MESDDMPPHDMVLSRPRIPSDDLPPDERNDAGRMRRRPSLRLVTLNLVIALEVVLLLIALVPQSVWADRGLPDGPIPLAMTPLVAGLFYVLPSLTGLLSRRWQAAVVLATLPAWLDLGVFAMAAATRIGPYYLAVEPHAVSTVGTLELFAALGALGWLARPLLARLSAEIRRMGLL